MGVQEIITEPERAAMSLTQIRSMRHNQLDFVGEVRDFDASQPIAPCHVAAIENAIDQFAVLVFRDQHLDDTSLVAFARNFGPLEVNGAPVNASLGKVVNFLRSPGKLKRLKQKLGGRRELWGDYGSPFSHLIQPINGEEYLIRNMLWHTDSSFKPTPAKYSMLNARTLPLCGGDTEFADMRAAWDALDASDKALTFDLVCRHSEAYSYDAVGFARPRDMPVAVPQRLVRQHPVTKRLSLYLASHAGAIDGMPTPMARILLRDLIEHATQRQFVYTHKWQSGDMIMWDNRVTMHRARRYDTTEARDLHRTTVADVAPTLEQ
jgi:alpha-ketoglutarate-dependent 2,4-dichlorophenoxyacetate dioxygenase